tara:strand:+ start:296 stop:658 length:363 start_codon:yes stop_codon:yes gene_type:complete
MKFNEYLTELRKRKFDTSKKICLLLKVEQSMWRKIEKGINPPPRKTLLQKFSYLANIKKYEENQLYALARRWEPSLDTNKPAAIITPSIEMMKKLKPQEYNRWFEAAIEANTPDYKNKYW